MCDPGQTAPSLLLPPCREAWERGPRGLAHGKGHMLAWDPRSGILTADAGITLEELCKEVIGDGYWLPAAPTTMKATLGECAARNVRGPGQFRAGSFGDHVIGFELRLAGGEILWCSREEHAGLFYAAIGGFGILGDILRLRLKMKKAPSGWLQVEAIPTRDLFMMMDEFEKRSLMADALAGWVDSLARGDLGRGILYQANHLAAREIRKTDSGLNLAEHEHPQRERGAMRAWLARPLQGLACRISIKLLHALKYRWARKAQGQQTHQTLAAFTFPLEAAPGWQWTPSPGILAQAGLRQYQCVVPRTQARHAFAQILKVSQDSRLTSCGATLTLRRADPFLLSNGIDGYALTIAFAVGRGLEDYRQLTRKLDAIVVEHGGGIEVAEGAVLEDRALERTCSSERLAELMQLGEEYNPENLRPCGLTRPGEENRPDQAQQETFKIALKRHPREKARTSSQEKLPAA